MTCKLWIFMKGQMYLRALTGRYTGTWLGYELSGDQFENAVDAIAERLSEDAVDSAYTVEENSISIIKPGMAARWTRRNCGTG